MHDIVTRHGWKSSKIYKSHDLGHVLYIMFIHIWFDSNNIWIMSLMIKKNFFFFTCTLFIIVCINKIFHWIFLNPFKKHSFGFYIYTCTCIILKSIRKCLRQPKSCKYGADIIWLCWWKLITHPVFSSFHWFSIF